MEHHRRFRQAGGPRRALAMHAPVSELIRNPELWAQLAPSDAGRLEGMVESYRKRLEPLGVFSRLRKAEGARELEPQQQRVLAALVLDMDEQYDRWKSSGDYFRQAKRRSKSGPGHVRKLAGKLARILLGVEKAAKDAQKVESSFAEPLLPTLTQAVKALQSASARLVPPGMTADEYAEGLQKLFENMSATHAQPYDPKQEVATRLVRYLRHEAGLKDTDAVVRAARIGNHFWGWDYEIQRTDLGILDCAGLRMLIGRAAARSKKRPRAAAAAPRGGSKRPSRQRTSTKKQR